MLHLKASWGDFQIWCYVNLVSKKEEISNDSTSSWTHATNRQPDRGSAHTGRTGVRRDRWNFLLKQTVKGVASADSRKGKWSQTCDVPTFHTAPQTLIKSARGDKTLLLHNSYIRWSLWATRGCMEDTGSDLNTALVGTVKSTSELHCCSILHCMSVIVHRAAFQDSLLYQCWIFHKVNKILNYSLHSKKVLQLSIQIFKQWHAFFQCLTQPYMSLY